MGLCFVWCGAKTIHSLPLKKPRLIAEYEEQAFRDDVVIAANTGLESPCVDREKERKEKKSVSSIMQSDGMVIPFTLSHRYEQSSMTTPISAKHRSRLDVVADWQLWRNISHDVIVSKIR